MTCRDCIHNNLCDMWAVESGIPFVNPNTCESFKTKESLIMEIWDNRTPDQIKADNQKMFQFVSFLGCIIAVIYMLMDMCG